MADPSSLLFLWQGAGSTRLLDCEGRLDDEEEQLRFWQAGGMDSWFFISKVCSERARGLWIHSERGHFIQYQECGGLAHKNSQEENLTTQRIDRERWCFCLATGPWELFISSRLTREHVREHQKVEDIWYVFFDQRGLALRWWMACCTTNKPTSWMMLSVSFVHPTCCLAARQ